MATKSRRICLESVETLYADGRWNGRPSIVLWRGEYYIAFRSSLSHGTIDNEMGKVLMLKSTDLKDWRVSTVVDDPEVDGAEPRCLVQTIGSTCTSLRSIPSPPRS